MQHFASELQLLESFEAFASPLTQDFSAQQPLQCSQVLQCAASTQQVSLFGHLHLCSLTENADTVDINPTTNNRVKTPDNKFFIIKEITKRIKMDVILTLGSQIGGIGTISNPYISKPNPMRGLRIIEMYKRLRKT